MRSLHEATGYAEKWNACHNIRVLDEAKPWSQNFVSEAMVKVLWQSVVWNPDSGQWRPNKEKQYIR